MDKIKVAVIGASGYAGLELVRLLARHPGCQLAAVTSLEYPGQPFSQIFPSLAGIVDLAFLKNPAPEEIAASAQVVFTAVPHQAAMGMIPAFLAQGLKVVDLSADFRFQDAGLYEKWYQPHTATDLLAEAVYGLPELHRDAVRRTRLVGNPGCYPTCVILGLAPLAKARLIRPEVIADCKSGVSGAGRQALLGISFCEVNDGFRAYKVLDHRHTPEMEQELSLLAGEPVQVTFTPHLVPMSRGILGTLYATLTAPRSEADLRELYREFYQGHPFVRLHPKGTLPDSRDVRGANFCDLALRVAPDGRRVIVVSVIDNLNKGAAGQAVQNFNLMCGFPETLGLETPPFTP
jgi:N-acetyl-gamma-glutamyl-phosphate reductase